MASQPIYGDNGEIVDHYDDGLPEEQSPMPAKAIAEQREAIPQQQAEAILKASLAGESQSWTIPDMLKETNDLFIGTTIHHDDGDPLGPLVSLFVREQPDGMVHVKTFRAAELSQHAFLDNLQKAIAATMQIHFLAWSERQRKKLEDETRQKARQSQASIKSSSTIAPMPTLPRTSSSPAPAPAQKTAKRSTAKEASKKPEQKYTTVSMFE